jgi:hypothetical protein
VALLRGTCPPGRLRAQGDLPVLYAQGAAAVKAPLQHWANAGGAAATGGAFYTGTSWPTQYRGLFFYGDYVKGWLRATATTGGTPVNFATNAGGPVAMEAGADSNLWYLAIGAGQLRQLRYGAARPRRRSPTASRSSATPRRSARSTATGRGRRTARTTACPAATATR